MTKGMDDVIEATRLLIDALNVTARKEKPMTSENDKPRKTYKNTDAEISGYGSDGYMLVNNWWIKPFRRYTGLHTEDEPIRTVVGVHMFYGGRPRDVQTKEAWVSADITICFGDDGNLCQTEEEAVTLAVVIAEAKGRRNDD